jgi:hypothetical protein
MTLLQSTQIQRRTNGNYLQPRGNENFELRRQPNTCYCMVSEVSSRDVHDLELLRGTLSNQLQLSVNSASTWPQLFSQNSRGNATELQLHLNWASTQPQLGFNSASTQRI